MLSEPGAVATGSEGTFAIGGASWSGRYRSRFWHRSDALDLRRFSVQTCRWSEVWM